ncbi:MAG: hypothetical protein ACYC6L_16675, partial [Anaerolineae bacterium]
MELSLSAFSQDKVTFHTYFTQQRVEASERVGSAGIQRSTIKSIKRQLWLGLEPADQLPHPLELFCPRFGAAFRG